MPLWTTTREPLQSVCGWAFSSEGRPWVAQRVCPSPTLPRPQHGPAGGVVAAVLEPLEPVQDDADGAPFPDVADDPAHYLWLAFFFCLRRAAQPALVTCLPRATASAPGGTSLVMVEPAPT